MGQWQTCHGKSQPTVTNLNNTIVINPNPNWWWLIVGNILVAANGPIPHVYIVRVNQSSLQSA